MSYDLHIERPRDPVTHRPAPIASAEWLSAVAGIEGLRIAHGPAKATNPSTGAVIAIAGSGADVEVLFPATQSWARVFRFTTRGTVAFRLTGAFDEPGDPVSKAARALATALHASVVGDDGEFYG